MATVAIQKKIVKELRSTNAELSFKDLVAKVRPNVASGRREVNAAIVPLLYRRQVTLTATRKFRIGA
jgi:hypothetical protein